MLVNKIDFKVKGVTYDNEENKDIQKEIKRILKEYKKNEYFDELYGGYTNKEIIEMDLNVSEYEGYKFPAKLVGDEYNGEECIKVYIKAHDDSYVHIGYVPKDELEEIAEWITRSDLRCDGNISIIGGRYKHCEIEENDEYEEVEKVVVEELTYGIEVNLLFYDDSKVKIDNNEKNIQKENNSKTIEWFLCLFFGYLGVHKFYIGDKASGLLYLCTFGLLGIGWLVDLFTIPLKKIITKS